MADWYSVGVFGLEYLNRTHNTPEDKFSYSGLPWGKGQVRTLNSTYSIQVLKDDLYCISGGWFDKEGLSPLQPTINGCTFGGSAIKVDIVAADGLHLEFGNRVITSRIRWFDVVRFEAERVN